MTTKSKKLVTQEQKAECRALKAIYDAKKKDLGLNQEDIAGELGISQGAVGHYLNGRNALNVRAAIVFSRKLMVDVAAFSPRLAEEISGIKTKQQAVLLEIAAALPPEGVDHLIDSGRGLIHLMGVKQSPGKD